MSQKLVKVERMPGHSLQGNWAIVGQLTGHIYYRSNRFDCCNELGNGRSTYEYEEEENNKEYERQQAVCNEQDELLDMAIRNGYSEKA